ncbi:hypothetical protein EA658_08330 [Pseudoxanthomonas winnipegensis]|uniref:Uncharacterized protein n=1 Tax=Pseudoxanthomonas winnipegensis TaxID=2480810 RepID=A0ABY1WG56_9GAMM|nr:hypothetical protein EA659_14625 [Pseudoxanthomonas winnipegensis]TAA20927.1 hypothetical protein EA658_08330 [Pseudoxanthomonas winnipegensis]TAH72396.1 hypothetical protein EA657_09050 [Pseudoxanthomonas winnipegensis]
MSRRVPRDGAVEAADDSSPSSPRKRGPMDVGFAREGPWIPAFAGMTVFLGRGNDGLMGFSKPLRETNASTTATM